VEKIVGWSVSNHLMTADNVSFSDEGKLAISSKSIEYGAQIMLNSMTESIPVRDAPANSTLFFFLTLMSSTQKSLKDIEFENEFEKRLLSEVIPANEIGVHFDDIGALEKVKNPLRELVMLPLQRPELFAHGNLTKVFSSLICFLLRCDSLYPLSIALQRNSPLRTSWYRQDDACEGGCYGIWSQLHQREHVNDRIQVVW